MKLSGTRVVVVDDTRDDVSNLLTYLDRNGVAYNYFYEGGDVNNLPITPLVGVRVVFLDFVLGTEGAPLATKMSTLMNVLSRVVSKENGPYIIMLWTRHNEQDGEGDLVPDFKTRLFENEDIPNPIAVIDLNKVEAMQDIGMIENRINDSLTDQNVFEVLFDWEKNGHEAAMHVLERLQSFAMTNVVAAANLDEHILLLQEEIKRHLYHFSVAATGKKDSPNPDVLKDSQLPFTAILADRLEQNINSGEVGSDSLIDSVNAKSTPEFCYSAEDVSIMNSYFAISNDNSDKPRPGNIYRRGKLIPRSEMTSYVYLETKDLYKKNRYMNRSGNAVDVENYTYLSRNIVPILFEITPSCDFAQGNWKGGRFVSGVLCPVTVPNATGGNNESHRYMLDAITAKPGSRILDVGLFQFNKKPYRLILHADYTLTIPLNKLKNKEPLFRAKKELLVSIQHWLSGHASRPGKTEF